LLTFDTDVLELWQASIWIGSWALGHWIRVSTGEERGERRELA